MAGFSVEWLSLREPLDRRSRSAALAGAFCAAVAGRDERPLVVDLGAGLGANAAYLAERLPAGHRWLLVDDDAALLAEAQSRRTGPPVETRQVDLARALDDAGLDAAAGITGSALLDLVSTAWLEALAARCAGRRLPLLFALSYDGRIRFAPPHDRDEEVRDLLNRDQRRDKGFGPALGPDAAGALAALLARSGYAVRSARSDWRLSAADDLALGALVDGIAAAARPAAADAGAIDAWRDARRRQRADRALTGVIGHVDVLALPA